MKKCKFSIISLIVVLMLVFTACGGSSDFSAASSVAVAPAAMAPQEPMSYKNTAMADGAFYDMEAAEMEESGIFDEEDSFEEVDETAAIADRKIVKHSNMELETKDFDTAFAQIINTVTQNGGYIESQNVNGQSLRYYDSYYERFANINARVPSDKLDAVCSSIGGVCNVTSQSEQIEDITDRYFDADAHLRTLQLQEERLLDILSKAEKLEDVITLEQALSEVRYEIESLTASLRRMDSQVRYSYLNISLHEVVEYKNIQSAPKTLSEKIADSFERSGNNLTRFFEHAMYFVIEDLPILVIRLAILAIVVFIAIKFVRAFKRRVNIPLIKRKNKDNEPPKAQ